MDPDEYALTMCEAAQEYINGVLSGEIVTGRLVRLQVQRHVRDLVTCGNRGLRFDVERAMRVYKFFSYLTHWQGEWAGEQFVISPWEAFIIWVGFGWVREDGTRRFRTLLIFIARKNGKTLFAAGLGKYLAFADGEAGAQVYTVATKRDQARISHRDALWFRRKSPTLTNRIQAFKDNLSMDSNGSKFEPLGANADSLDGLNVHAFIADEFHRHKSRDLWDVLEQGMGARTQPMGIGISTSGNDAECLCYEMRDLAIKVLEGTILDDSLFAYIAEPDPEDDWDDRSIWIKGNPNLGVSVKVEKLEEDLRRANDMPSAVANFKRYRLNLWVTGAADAWMDMEQWNACVPVPMALEGRRCFGGMDLAATQDVCAFVLYFPSTDDDPRSHALAYFWVPKDNIKKLEKHYRVPLQSWVDEGWVTATPGNTVDQRHIRKTITGVTEEGVPVARCLATSYDIEETGYDDWNSTAIATDLIDDGLDILPLQQTVKTYSAPMIHLADEVASGVFNHGNNPVMRWMASNVRAASDPSGRTKPMKSEGKRRHKIDGMTAVLMAIARAIVERPKKGSVYDTRGVVGAQGG